MRPVSDVACHKLAELVARYGRDLGDDPRRCEALLRDVCGQQYKREIFVLVSAARERVPAQLQQSSAGNPAEVVLTRLIQHLRDNLGLSEDLARWAVESWAFAMKAAGYGHTKPRPVGSLGTAGSDYSRTPTGLSAEEHDLFAEFPSVSTEEVLRQTIRGVLADGIVTDEERAEVEKLRGDLGIAPEAAARLLAEVAAELRSRPGAGSSDSARNSAAAPSAAAPSSPSPRPSGATSKARATPRSLVRPRLILFVLLAALGARWMFGSGRSEFESTRAKAEQGIAEAQVSLGVMYANGHGVHQDYEEAVKWFRKAAEQGDGPGERSLGQAYADGDGVPQDYEEAFKWFREAAEQGDARGQGHLGRMYATGHGVPQDYDEAVKWLRKAAEQGDAWGQIGLGVAYEHGHGVPQDYEEAFKWYRKAAEQGDAGGQTSLGAMYEDGTGVPQDYEEAVKWYRKAAEQSNARGQGTLGVMYANGHGVPQDYEEAVKWLRKAVEQGDAGGQRNLGVMYANGHGVPQDYEEAVKWYRKAAEQGDAEAKRYLVQIPTEAER